MPRANPESFFEVAVRHLFRHIKDVDALRSNPLLHGFFSRGERDGKGGEVLPKIHARIQAEAALSAKSMRQKSQRPALAAGEKSSSPSASASLRRVPSLDLAYRDVTTTANATLFARACRAH